MFTKKIFLFIAVSALTLALALSLVSCDKCKDGHVDSDKDFICDECGGDMPCDHIDDDGDFLCDKCGEFYEAPIVYADFKITVYNDDTSAFEGVRVLINDAEGTEVLNTLTDKNGEVKGNLATGKYFISFELDSDGYVYVPGGYIEIKKENNSFTYTAIDNTPDGTPEKPFFISDDEVVYTIPAGATYTFTLKGETRTMIIENSSVSVSYGGTEYTPVDNKIEVSVSGPTDPSDPPTAFTVTNTADSDNEVTLRFVSPLGSRNNPFSVTNGMPYTTEIITYEDIIYYVFTATDNGTVHVSSETEENYIKIMNTTTSRVSEYTDGTVGSTVSLRDVNEGDRILIEVSTDSESGSAVEFILHFVVPES
ncbi:MAG: hypothetical protein IJW03_02205 [Clostridia bacterium]|nr:hypothetical protein [Clostridia bacterium]